MGISIRELGQQEHREAARVAARALRDNPSSTALFPGAEGRRERALVTIYTILLHNAGAPVLGAVNGDRLVGLAFYAPPGTCYYTRRRKALQIQDSGRRIRVAMTPMSLRSVAGLLRLGPRANARLAAVSRVGMRHDPEHAHTHVELVGVLPELRGQGIGTQLMRSLEARTGPEPAFLETDTERNVSFYRRLGYETIADDEVLGFRYWYMERVR